MPSDPQFHDLCDLPAPEPLEESLRLSAMMRPGDRITLRTPRPPLLLLPHLEKRGIRYELEEQPDGSALLRLRHPMPEENG